MTRDEALVKYNEIDRRIGIRPFWEVRDIIENLCSQIEEMQNRSCGNCKYFTSSPNTNKYDCCEKGIADTSISFCCNKWEVRDESIRDTKFN